MRNETRSDWVVRACAFLLALLGGAGLLGRVAEGEGPGRAALPELASAWYELGPTHTAMPLGTAGLFLLCALVLLLPLERSARGHRAVGIVNTVILVFALSGALLPLLPLVPSADGFTEATAARALYGWPVPVASLLGFAAAGTAFLLGSETAGRRARTAVRGLTGWIAGLGAFGIAGFLVQAQLLFSNYWLADLSLPIAVGLLLLAIAMYAQWTRLGWTPVSAESEVDRITAASAGMLSAIALIAGVSCFSILQGRVQTLVSNSVLEELTNRSAMFSDFLDQRQASAEITATRPAVIGNLRKIHAGQDDGSNLANVQAVAEGFLKLGFSALAYSDVDGKLVASAGAFAGAPAMRVPLKTSGAFELLWQDGFVLRARLPMSDAMGAVGFVVVEQPMPVLARSMLTPSRLGETTEVGLCALAGTRMACFPQRVNPRAYSVDLLGMDGRPLSMTRALRGESGVAITRDYRNRNVIAAFGPVDQLGLGLVVKIDTVEIFGPIREQLLLSGAVLLALVGIGTWLLRARVNPLVASMLLSTKALHENQQQFETVVAGVKDYAIITLDLEGKVVSWNAGAQAIKGYSAQEIMGRHFSQFYPESDIVRHKPEHEIVEVLAEGRFEDEGWRVRKDGSQFWANVVITVLHDKEGRPRGFVKFTRDMSERRRMEQVLQLKNTELEKASQAKDLFLAGMSHELRTPLNAIIGFTGTLLMKLPGPLLPEQEKQLRTVQSSGRHLLSLINDLLQLAKLNAGPADLKSLPVDGNAVVEEVVALLRVQAEKAGLLLAAHLPAAPLILQTDKRALTQILINLLGNAIKFTERGHVEIRLQEKLVEGARRMAVFSVTDTGPGIRAEDQLRLFKAFARVEPAQGSQPEGTGLGLHLSRTLAEKLGGHLGLESRYGHGSTFYLELPFGET